MISRPRRPNSDQHAEKYSPTTESGLTPNHYVRSSGILTAIIHLSTAERCCGSRLPVGNGSVVGVCLWPEFGIRWAPVSSGRVSCGGFRDGQDDHRLGRTVRMAGGEPCCQIGPGGLGRHMVAELLAGAGQTKNATPSASVTWSTNGAAYDRPSPVDTDGP
jgi:hypothetical protein